MFEIIKGDLEPDLPLTVSVDGVGQDLTSATSYTLHWLKPDGTTADVSLTPIALASGTLKRVWSSGDTNITGYHRARIVVVWPTAQPQTFPNDGSWYYWAVYPSS